MRNLIKTVIITAAAVLGLGGRAEAKLRVVASIEVLADLSRQVGGDRVDVTSLSRGYQDPHFVEAKPSLVLESRNGKIQRGQPGNIDTSTAIRPEDVPTVPSDQLRALGDVHPLGNPHYWIPPKNARAIARLLAERFTALDAAGAAAYKAELARFEARLAAKEKEWDAAAAPLKGTRIVT